MQIENQESLEKEKDFFNIKQVELIEKSSTKRMSFTLNIYTTIN